MLNIPAKVSRLLAAGMMIVLIVSLAACQAAPSATPTATAAPTAVPTEAEETPAADSTAAADATPAATATPYVLDGATTTDSGLQYLELTPGTGKAPEVGDVVTLQYSVTLPNGTELANTYTTGEKITTVWRQDNLLPGWVEMIGMMKAGGKAKCIMTGDLAFGESNASSVPSDTSLIVELDLLAVEAPPVPATVAEDKFTTSESGLQYYDLTVGDGDEAVASSTVATHYKVWVKTDSGFDYVDKSQEDAPVKFVIGRMDVVFAGWDEGTTGMKIGGKRQLIIPSDLAMGAEGGGPVPANATLVMEIELINVTEPQVATEVKEADYTTTASGLKYYDLVPGTGASPTTGQTIVVDYTGWLEDGTVFDSSLESGNPFIFKIGTGAVIPGWDEGVATMKVGGKRQLVIPADLAYGESGSGSIPANATLIFEVELLEIQE